MIPLRVVHLALGEIDEAVLPNKPFWDPLRPDPRFDELLRRMNLPILSVAGT